jgi:hypothetical protein
VGEEGKIWGSSRKSRRLIKLKGTNGAEKAEARNHQVREFVVGNIKSRIKTESQECRGIAAVHKMKMRGNSLKGFSIK